METSTEIPTINVLHTIGLNYEKLGIRDEPKLIDRISLKCFVLLAFGIVYFIALSTFFIFESTSVTESGDAFFLIGTLISIFFISFRNIYDGPQVRRMIATYEAIFRESK